MEFALPPVGEGVFEVELVRWLVRAGDVVKPGQPMLEVLSDKATMEVPSPFAGRIDSLSAEAGTKIQVGQTVLNYTPASGSRQRAEEPAKVVAAASTTATATLAPPVVRTQEANGHAIPAAPSVR